MTLATVMAGAIAKKILSTLDIEVLAHSIEIGGVKVEGKPVIDDVRKHTYTNVMRCADPRTATIMHKAVLDARAEGDSVGGIAECIALNFPPGIGTPIFDALDADLAKMLLTIPAVKGVEFGAGFNASRLRGSKNNDQYVIRGEAIHTLTNNAGGILGGLSNGMPIVIRVGFKPTPSISKKQQTVDLQKHEDTTIEIRGRHDACIVPRAVPVVEAATAIVLVDHLLRHHYDGMRETADE
jgi:chorismate synthase